MDSLAYFGLRANGRGLKIKKWTNILKKTLQIPHLRFKFEEPKPGTPAIAQKILRCTQFEHGNEIFGEFRFYKPVNSERLSAFLAVKNAFCVFYSQAFGGKVS